jgi:hypothetical protein
MSDTPERDPEFPYTIEFYDDPTTGRQPVLEWMRGLPEIERKALGAAIRHLLQRKGLDVCQGEWGKQLGGGVFEFRVRHTAEESLARFSTRTPPAGGKAEITRASSATRMATACFSSWPATTRPPIPATSGKTAISR